MFLFLTLTSVNKLVKYIYFFFCFLRHAQFLFLFFYCFLFLYFFEAGCSSAHVGWVTQPARPLGKARVNLFTRAWHWAKVIKLP